MGSLLFYTATAGFLIGVFARSFFAIDLYTIAWTLLLSFVCAVVSRRKCKTPYATHILLASLFLLTCCLGMVRMDIATYGAINTFFEDRLATEITVEGVVVREPDERASSVHLYTKVGDELILVTTDKFVDIVYGDRIAVTGELTKPESFETDLGRTFNYPQYLQARGVSYMMRFADVSHIASDEGNLVVSYLLAFKHTLMKGIESVLPEPQAGLSEGLLLGVKRALGEELESAFRTTGIIHIVVLSGYNVMLVVVFIMFFSSFFLPLQGRLVFGILAIGAFALIVGLSATVVRASIMASLMLVAKATGRTYTVIRALFVTGIGMVALNPYLLAFDTGFQLSFVATLGLILVSPYLEKKATFMPKAFGLREFLVATLATQIFVTPLLLYQIGEFSVIAVVVNLLVLPMVPVAMLLTAIAGALSFVWLPLANFVGVFATFSLSYILVIAQFFAQLPFASFVVPAFPFWVVVLSYLSFAILMLYYLKTQTQTKSVEAKAPTPYETLSLFR